LYGSPAESNPGTGEQRKAGSVPPGRGFRVRFMHLTRAASGRPWSFSERVGLAL